MYEEFFFKKKSGTITGDINIFAFAPFFSDEKEINHYVLKMNQIWHMSFWVPILRKSFTKIVIKNSYVKLDAFSS